MCARILIVKKLLDYALCLAYITISDQTFTPSKHEVLAQCWADVGPAS